MTTTDLKHPNAYAALVAARSDVKPLHAGRTATIPTKTGGSYGYTYASLGDVIAVVTEALGAHGLVAVQDLGTDDKSRVTVTTRILWEGGTSIDFGPFSMPTGATTAQDVGSAASYARRYALLAALGLTAEDDDGAGASTPPPPPQRQRKPPKPKTTPAPDELLEALQARIEGLDEPLRQMVKARWPEGAPPLRRLDADQAAAVVAIVDRVEQDAAEPPM